jgi:DNA primase
VEKLAAQYGVVIERESSVSSRKRAEMLEVNRLAAKYFFDNIKVPNNEGYKYITGRGITPETIKEFGLGYTGTNFYGLYDHLKKNKVSEETMIELGLVSKNDKGKVYDKYRSRLMFPIIDTRGKIIGFGGRIIGDGEPKYLNSSESTVFLKKNNLYGLNMAKSSIQQEGYAFLVEGYMDMVSLYQNGICNVVASLGTALTENQAKLLKRYCKKVILCYDADAAGIKAAVRGIDVLRSADMEVKVLHVENAKDPDEYVKKFGKDAFLKLALEKTLDHVDYKVALIQKKYKRNTNADNVKFIKAVAKVISTLTPAEQEVYSKYLSGKLGISEETLVKESKAAAEKEIKVSEVKGQSGEKPKEKVISKSDVGLEKMMIKLSYIKSEYFKVFDSYEEAFISDAGMEIGESMRASYKEGKDFDIDELKDNLSEESYTYLERIIDDTLVGDEEAAYNDCVRALDNKQKEKRIREIQDILKMMDEMPDDDRAKDESLKLMKELSELRKKR